MCSFSRRNRTSISLSFPYSEDTKEVFDGAWLFGGWDWERETRGRDVGLSDLIEEEIEEEREEEEREEESEEESDEVEWLSVGIEV